MCERLQSAGVPLKPNRDQAWRDFAGWRVNYDTTLRILAGLTMAPDAPWSGDRALRIPVRLFRREEGQALPLEEIYEQDKVKNA